MTVLEGAGVLHRPFLRSFRGVGIFSVARHVYAPQLRSPQLGGWWVVYNDMERAHVCNWSGFFLFWSRVDFFHGAHGAQLGSY